LCSSDSTGNNKGNVVFCGGRPEATQLESHEAIIRELKEFPDLAFVRIMASKNAKTTS
jgi:hypothetical protein